MTEELVRDSPVPLYAQLAQVFRRKISTREWAPGDRIPSENEFALQYGMSRMTVRGVLTKLVDQGLLFRVPGKGTFVAEDKIHTKSPAYQGVRGQLEAMGLKTSTELLKITTHLPSASVRGHLQLGQREEVFSIERLRRADGEPISLHFSYVPASLAPQLDRHDLETEQLCIVLDTQYHLRMKRVEERLESVPANADAAMQLGITPGDPILRLEDTITDPSGIPFEFSRILFRGDKVQVNLTVEL